MVRSDRKLTVRGAEGVAVEGKQVRGRNIHPSLQHYKLCITVFLGEPDLRRGHLHHLGPGRGEAGGRGHHGHRHAAPRRGAGVPGEGPGYLLYLSFGWPQRP